MFIQINLRQHDVWKLIFFSRMFHKNEFKFLAINVKNQTLSLQFFAGETKTLFLLK